MWAPRWPCCWPAPGPFVNEVLALLGIQLDLVIWEMVLDFAPAPVPYRENIVIYATGWAAKLVPLIGKICVDLAFRQTTPHDIEKLRFGSDLLVEPAAIVG